MAILTLVTTYTGTPRVVRACHHHEVDCPTPMATFTGQSVTRAPWLRFDEGDDSQKRKRDGTPGAPLGRPGSSNDHLRHGLDLICQVP